MRNRQARVGPVGGSDQELVAGVLAGSEASFTALYERYFDQVVRFAGRRLPDPTEAEDVAQEVFLHVFCGLDRFEGRSSLLTWILGISQNRVRLRFRKRLPVAVGPEALETLGSSRPAPCLDRRIDATRILQECQRTLDEQVSAEQREAFLLRYVENHPIQAVADQLGKTPQAVKTGLLRSRRALQRRARQLDAFLDAA